MSMEKIIGSLVGVNGHTFDIVYDLFFTTERVIAVIIRHPADNPRQFTSVWQTVFLGGAWKAPRENLKQERTAQEKRRSLQSLTPDELVNAHPRNFEIRYSEIASVEIRRRLFQSQLWFHLSGPTTAGQITRFNLPKKQVAEAQRLLKLVSLSETSGK
jgi:hypothetical protein